MNDDYIVIQDITADNGLKISQTKEVIGKMLIKQYSGINSENFVIKKQHKLLRFSVFKLNGIHYINLNGEHILDYKRFVHIQQISSTGEDSIKLKNSYVGDINISNCDPDMFKKGLDILANYMKNKITLMSQLFYFIFH